MFTKGNIIDTKYKVDGICSTIGGMGTLLFVTPLSAPASKKLVLKYCNRTDDESLKRFRREVRLLATFTGNSKVVQILDKNLEHDPPYFVMPYYTEGDLSKHAGAINASPAAQEKAFLLMADCIQELHGRKEFHRDIKPANFLMENGRILVSDFGLTTEIGSDTAFTQSSAWCGTPGFIPPEFFNGGFKNADAPGDIFMLGKTMYVLLTSRAPQYLDGSGIPTPLFHVIERCCNITKARRYQTIAQLKQALSAAYDVILARAGGIGKTKQLLSAINDQLEQKNTYDVAAVSEFIEQAALLDIPDQVKLCTELSDEFIDIIGQEHLAAHLPGFLDMYEKLVESKSYGWGYAEDIADRMKRIFSSDAVPVELRVRSLDLAVRAAYYMNRFAAMDTCKVMVTSIIDEVMGLQVAALIQDHRATFLAHIEPSECQSELIRAALRQVQAELAEAQKAQQATTQFI